MLAAPLRDRPISTAVAYTVIGVLPLFLVSAQSVSIQADLGIGQSRIGIAVSAYFAVAAVASLTLGPWVDRLGAAGGLRVGAAVGAMVTLALATVVVRWELLAILLGLAGLSNTIAQLASNLVVAAHAATRRQGLGFGLKQAAVPIANLMAGLLVTTAGDRLPWRWAFVGATVVGVIAVAMVPAFGDGAVIRTKRRWIVPPRSLAALALAGATGAAMGNALAVFTVDAAVAVGFAVAVAGGLLTMGSAVSVAVRVIVGWVTGERGSDGSLPLIVQLGLAAAAFTVLARLGDRPVAFVLAVAVAFGSAWAFPGLIYYVAVRTHQLPAATATGIVLAGVYLGSVVGPSIVGFVAENGSYTTAWWIAAGSLTLSTAAAVMARVWSRRSISG